MIDGDARRMLAMSGIPEDHIEDTIGLIRLSARVAHTSFDDLLPVVARVVATDRLGLDVLTLLTVWTALYASDLAEVLGVTRDEAIEQVHRGWVHADMFLVALKAAADERDMECGMDCANPDHEPGAWVNAPSTPAWDPCGLGVCAAPSGHQGTCAEASGWAAEAAENTTPATDPEPTETNGEQR